jgi:membrane associated rhomboid family serine protease
MRSGGSWRWVERFTFGGRVPGGVGLVLALTIATSLIVAFGSRHTVSLYELAQLSPARVFRGEVWRLVTWELVELSPFSLLFSCLVLYFFGRDLAGEWGSPRFLRVYGATTLVAAAGTCLVALVDRDAFGRTFIGSWPLAAAMTVAWGLWFPDREIRIWFVLPLKGIVLAWLTVGLTVVSAIYFGWEHVLPWLFAEGSMLAWLFRHSLAARASRMTHAVRTARSDAAKRAYAEKRRSSEEVLRSLEEKDDDLAPLPPEIESVLGGKKKERK